MLLTAKPGRLGNAFLPTVFVGKYEHLASVTGVTVTGVRVKLNA